MILPRFNSPLKNDLYKRLFAELEGTSYWGKYPDLKVGKTFYEHEGHNNLTKSVSNMIKRGLKQSDCIVVDYDEQLYTIGHLKKLIKFSIKEGKQNKRGMGIKKRWGLRAGRVLTINPNAYEKINLNIGVGVIESAESMPQRYKIILNYQNFFQLSA